MSVLFGMGEGHSFNGQTDVCVDCGITREEAVDGGPVCCWLLKKCVECTLTRRCYSTMNGPTCHECAANIRAAMPTISSTSRKPAPWDITWGDLHVGNRPVGIDEVDWEKVYGSKSE